MRYPVYCGSLGLRLVLAALASAALIAGAGAEDAAPPSSRPQPSKAGTLEPGDLDRLLRQALGQADFEVVDDAEFLRRATFDALGRPPRLEELEAFLADTSDNKREAAIERLITSPEFGNNWATYWTDVIAYRVPEPELTFLDYTPLRQWLASEINSGRPWSKTVSELLTASGKVGDRPAAAFVGFHQANPQRLTAETTRVFLGVQVQCAECHDHPFVDLSRETFHHLAAFFARTQAKLPWNESAGIEVSDRGKGEYKMPDAHDPRKGEVMQPAAFGTQPLELGTDDATRRTALAAWLTAPDNPWFAKAYVNRVWARLMGRGFCEPVDDLSELADTVLPEIHQAVADHFAASDFDHRAVFRLLMRTRAYQRRVLGVDADHPLAALQHVRLRGDEVFYALATGMRLPNITPPKEKPTAENRFPVPPKSTQDLVNQAFGYDPSLPTDLIRWTMQQAMFMMNNRQIQQQINAAADANTLLAELLQQHDDNAAVVEQLYLRLLARRPTSREQQILGEHLAAVGDRRAAFEDVLWSLINSAEFVTRR